jgi:hypothetical protein
MLAGEDFGRREHRGLRPASTAISMRKAPPPSCPSRHRPAAAAASARLRHVALDLGIERFCAPVSAKGSDQLARSRPSPASGVPLRARLLARTSIRARLLASSSS